MANHYTLRLSEEELNRYRMMASFARAAETEAWAAAGIDKGARVVDIGCGPGLPLLELADGVGPEGMVVGIDQSEEARQTAAALIAEAGIGNAEVRSGDAAATGLPAGLWDVVHLRHVLLHNGPRIADILRHASALLRPDGRLYLNETDATAHRFEFDLDPVLVDMDGRYWQMLADMGNDLQAGPHLGRYAAAAGFEVVYRKPRIDAFPMPADIRPPSWAGRDAMVEAGVCTREEVDAWDRALATRPPEGNVFVPQYTLVGRKPGA